MFCIVDRPRAWWPVTFAGVTDAGDVIENSFRMRFLVLDEDENIALLKEAQELMGRDESSDARQVSEMARDMVIRIAEDWQDVGNEGGEALPWTPENVQRLMKVPNVFRAVFDAYRACRAAEPDRRAGN